MIYNKWDIILVPFPFTNLETVKKRPALVISSQEYNKNTDVVIAFITSQLNTKSKLGDYLITNWQQANLPKPSMLRMKFATINNAIIIKKLGTLSTQDARAFLTELTTFFSSE